MLKKVWIEFWTVDPRDHERHHQSSVGGLAAAQKMFWKAWKVYNGWNHRTNDNWAFIIYHNWNVLLHVECGWIIE
jgi:hypothetical protein